MNITIGVEISPFCNLRCEHCNVSQRLHLDDRRFDVDLVTEIVNNVPNNTTLIFIGLGEPTLPNSQKQIVKILNLRNDLNGFIQINGTFKLTDEMATLIKSGRLEIGLSYDGHHLASGQKLRIQKELVSGLAIAVDGTEQFDYESIKSDFTNLNRILISPLMLEDNKLSLQWHQMDTICKTVKLNLPDVTVYTEFGFLPNESKGHKLYYDSAKSSSISHLSYWRFNSLGNYYLDFESIDADNQFRIMANGTITTNVRDAFKSWEELDHLPTIAEFFQKI